MTISVEATYENGVLKLAEPLPLKDREVVRLILQTGETPLLRAHGIMGFQGTPEEADFFALDPALDPRED